MAGSLFESKIIKNEIKDKYKMMIEMYEREVDAVWEIFESRPYEFMKTGLKVTAMYSVKNVVVSMH